MLTLYPAIDLKDGAVVRLRRGDMQDATLYGTDPAAQALAWQSAGFGWLHVVDLNGAFAGRSVNTEAVAAILAAVSVPVQLGGGLRTMADIERWLAAGVARIILGSAAVKDPKLVREAARAHPGRVAVGIDAREGFVATEGWAEASTLRADELALAESVSAPVIASGGVGCAADLRRLRAAGDGRIEGVIVGRALYDGRLDAAEAMRIRQYDGDAAA
jgi:phosphoribosylformimino-5-aminoimidazole carboxamide ribotide isomerase